MDFLGVYKKWKSDQEIVTSNNFEVRDEKDLLLQGLNNNFSFIKSKFLEGKLYIGTNSSFNSALVWSQISSQNVNSQIIQSGYVKRLNQACFDHLRAMIKELQDMYPDSWNLEVVYNKYTKDLFIKGFTIYFPQIKLVNNRKDSHILRDVYTANSLFVTGGNDRTLNVGTLFSTRLTTTEEEEHYGYFHSHISGGSVGNHRPYAGNSSNNIQHTWYNMCLGGYDSGILKEISEFNSNSTLENFRKVLLNIRSTMRYESLEGGPYRKIADMRYHFSNRRNTGRSSITNQLRIENYTDSDSPKQASDFLLLHALRLDPNLSFKFTIKDNPFLYKEVTFQDDLKLKKAIIDAYKDLSTKVATPDDLIVIEDRAKNKRHQLNLKSLSKVFYQDSPEGRKAINPYYFYLPEEQTNTVSNQVITYGNSPFIFRGELKRSEIIAGRGETVGSNSYSKINPQSLDLQISDKYFKQIKNNLTNKITKNVFIEQETVES